MAHRILIVDDDVLMLEALHDLFESSGYEVKVANRGQKALKILEEETFDLLILDVVMPKMTGFDVCIEVRKRKDTMRGVKIIMLTAKAKSRDPKSDACGCDLYIAKPVEPGKLLKIVQNLLANPPE